MITVNEMERKLRVLKEYLERHHKLEHLLHANMSQIPLVDAYIEALALAADDKQGWIDWYVWENDFGRRKHKAGLKGNQIVVDRVGRLMKVIEMTREVKG